jgi:hypothetical protein
LILSNHYIFILSSIWNISLHILITCSHLSTTIRSTNELEMLLLHLWFLWISHIANFLFSWSTISSDHFYIRTLGWYYYVCWFFIRGWRFNWPTEVCEIIGILRMVVEVLLLLTGLGSWLHFIIIIILEIKLLPWCIIIKCYIHRLSLLRGSNKLVGLETGFFHFDM